MKFFYVALCLFFFNSSLVYGEQNSYLPSSNEIEQEIDAGFSDESFDDFDSEFSDEFSKEFEVQGETDFDPLSGYNRLMTSFNHSLYTYLVFPLGRGYNYITPTQFRVSVGNFFDNLQYPVRVLNNLLQLKFANSLEESGRFLVNSTIGIFGLFDPAKSWLDWDPHDEDFGQTLGYYGVGGGFHVVLPFFGPSNLRDTLSLPVDWYIDPFFYQEGRSYNLLTQNFWQSIGLKSFEYFNKYSGNIEGYETMTKDAIDLYPLLKNIYEQNRQMEIEK